MTRALSLCLMLVALPVSAQTVVDGDTLKLNGTTYRLHGIDAPELKQECPNGFMAGEYAAAFLRQIIDGRKVECEWLSLDRYGRLVAVCRADGYDLGAWMVRQGMAWAYVKYSKDYSHFEDIAKDLKIGIHGAGCVPAWQYRNEKR